MNGGERTRLRMDLHSGGWASRRPPWPGQCRAPPHTPAPCTTGHPGSGTCTQGRRSTDLQAFRRSAGSQVTQGRRTCTRSRAGEWASAAGACIALHGCMLVCVHTRSTCLRTPQASSACTAAPSRTHAPIQLRTPHLHPQSAPAAGAHRHERLRACALNAYALNACALNTCTRACALGAPIWLLLLRRLCDHSASIRSPKLYARGQCWELSMIARGWHPSSAACHRDQEGACSAWQNTVALLLHLPDPPPGGGGGRGSAPAGQR